MRESSVEVMHDSSHYVVDRTPSKRLRKDDNLMPVLSRFRGRTRKGANTSRPHHSKWDMRSREPSTSAVGPKVNPGKLLIFSNLMLIFKFYFKILLHNHVPSSGWSLLHRFMYRFGCGCRGRTHQISHLRVCWVIYIYI
ncbi:hypothetical protein CsSME_00013772 [Camellia sinensis var. sinensis]